MIKRILAVICAVSICIALTGCATNKKVVKIGVSMGVGEAARWPQEIEFMKARAQKLGIELQTRLNKTDTPKTQEEDCKELVDSGIDVLILTPRDVENVKEILDYAYNNNVKVVNYARVALNKPIELFVGFDAEKVGQNMGQYLAESRDKGDYILLRGDAGDGNANLLYKGAMRYISQIEDNINVILDSEVKGWSPDEAKRLVTEAIAKNGNKVDAILAPNDKLAGACAQAVKELGVENVIITGMDAELDAIKRIAAGTQSCTFHIDIEMMANVAIDAAYNIAIGKEIVINTDYNNGWEGGVPANLVTGKLITKQNIDKLIIEQGLYTKEQVYGE